MESRWSPADAPEDALAQRVHASRLLGAEPSLVVWGGGNTSVKIQTRDILGEAIDVLCVKGSGWDLADIEPEGLPAVRMPGLIRLAALEELSDEEMVNQLRTQLLDASAPTPSVEALLHASRHPAHG